MTARKVPVKKPVPQDVFIVLNPYDGVFASGSSVEDAHEELKNNGYDNDVSNLEFYRARKINVSVEYVVKEV